MANRKLLEKQVEDWLAVNLHLIEPGLRSAGQQVRLPHPRIAKKTYLVDILAYDQEMNPVVIEIKRGFIGDVIHLHQLLDYIEAIDADARGVIVGRGISKGLKDALPDLNITFFQFGLGGVPFVEVAMV